MCSFSPCYLYLDIPVYLSAKVCWMKLNTLVDHHKSESFSLSVFSLSDCSITEKQSLILTLALKSNLSHLRELDLSGNKLGNTGVKHLCVVLKDSHCKLERLRSVTFTENKETSVLVFE